MMRSKTFRLIAVLVLCAGLHPAAIEDKKPGPAGRLVRLDLLRKPSRGDVRVSRNIFLLGFTAAETFLGQEGPPSAAGPPAPGPETASGQAPAGAEIRYLGWVATSGKAVGLIFTGSEALALSEGDTFGGGFVVRSIKPDAVEVETPDGRIVTIPVEGGRR
jgi:hypothetical protein